MIVRGCDPAAIMEPGHWVHERSGREYFARGGRFCTTDVASMDSFARLDHVLARISAWQAFVQASDERTVGWVCSVCVCATALRRREKPRSDEGDRSRVGVCRSIETCAGFDTHTFERGAGA